MQAITRGLVGFRPAIDALANWRGSKLGLRAHLLLFGLAIVLPVLCFSAYVLYRYTQAERVANEARALGVARALSADIDREITAIITTLEALGTSRLLAGGRYEEFHEQAKQALKSRPWNVVLIDANRQQLMNTRLPRGAALPVSASSEPDLASIVQRTGSPYVSDLFVGTVAQRPIFAVSVPVMAAPSRPAALVMSLEPERLVEILGEAALPDGWVAAVADRKNINMARTRLAREFLGRAVPEESTRQYSGRAEGVVETVDLEGKRALHAFRFSALTGWRVAAWAPVDVVESRLRAAWLTFLLAGAVLLSLSLLLALGIGRLMATPIGELARAGVALGEGKLVAPISSTLREADELSTTLSQAADKLQHRMGAQAHLAAIVSSSPSGIASLSPEGVIRTWNPAAARLYGYEPSEVIGKSVRMFYPEGGQEDFDKLAEDVRAGATVHADVQRRHKDGSLLDVSINVAPMYDDIGQFVGISAIVRDIADRKMRERHIEFLLRELAHRSKNMLAVVQAIAGQTARHSRTLTEFQDRLSERVHAMARTQDLLVASNWTSANLGELVRAQLEPFLDGATDRIEMRGPELELKPDLVHSITLAVHELATNAAKYGALSVPEGRVLITWEMNNPENEGGKRRFRMCWRESNGPPVAPPTRKGFGHVVIADIVAMSLGGEVTLEFAPEGLRWTLDLPNANITPSIAVT